MIKEKHSHEKVCFVTGDNIFTYILLLTISGLIIGVTVERFIKREN